MTEISFFSMCCDAFSMRGLAISYLVVDSGFTVMYIEIWYFHQYSFGPNFTYMYIY